MQLDPKLLKDLTNVIKLLSVTSDEIGKKSRELITVMIAIQRGFLDATDKMDQVFADIASGKFEEGRFKETMKELAKTEEQITVIK